jgi:ligand-binding sensor domain-containing protein
MFTPGASHAAHRLPGSWVLLLWLLLGGGGAGPGVAGQPDIHQDFTIDSWQTDEGLPQNSVKSTVQTPDGYLWLATFNGLARFDGVRFTVLDTSIVPGLPGNRLVWLHVDRQGRVWLVTEYNELALLAEGGCHAFGSREGVPPGGIEWVGEDGQGGLWAAAADGGLGRLQDGRFVPVPASAEFATNGTVRLLNDAAGRLWCLRTARSLPWSRVAS